MVASFDIRSSTRSSNFLMSNFDMELTSLQLHFFVIIDHVTYQISFPVLRKVKHVLN